MESYIPPFIWQTYKTKKLPEQANAARETWISKNPGWVCELYDDSDIEAYIRQFWNHKMLHFFHSLPIGVMKADLWRYLILKTHGGVYTDIDSECKKPIVEWKKGINIVSKDILMIGLENNEHFCQWTIYSTKEHPIMKYVCAFILSKFETNGIDTNKANFVHATTGPGVWTDAIASFFSMEGSSSHAIFNTYNKNPSYFNLKGLYILNQKYYDGIYSKNLYGSQTFGDGYIKWIDEVLRIH